MGRKTQQTISLALDWACAELSKHNIDMREARDLLSFSLGATDAYLIAHPNNVITAPAVKRFKLIVRKRLRGMPFAYVTGTKGFYGLDFIVNKNVLIPRPETEGIIDWTLGTYSRDGKHLFVDVGTGSGCIAITLAKYFPYSRVIAIDKSKRALEVAKQNVRLHKMASRIRLRHGSLLEPLKKTDAPNLVVSNPPYLEKHELENVPYEPVEALYGGKNGLEYVDALVTQIFEKKIPAGIIEISPTQEHWLAYRLEAQQEYNFRFILNTAGKIRFVAITKK